MKIESIVKNITSFIYQVALAWDSYGIFWSLVLQVKLPRGRSKNFCRGPSQDIFLQTFLYDFRFQFSSFRRNQPLCVIPK